MPSAREVSWNNLADKQQKNPHEIFFQRLVQGWTRLSCCPLLLGFGKSVKISDKIQQNVSKM